MYLVLDIVDYVPGVARGLTDGHHLGALTQMAPPDSSHTAVHQTLFCIFLYFWYFLTQMAPLGSSHVAVREFCIFVLDLFWILFSLWALLDLKGLRENKEVVK